MNKENWTDEELLALLPQDGELAVERLFQKYYEYLCVAVYRILPDPVTVEDLVQEVFMEVWRKHKSLNIQTSLKAYLKRAAINKTLNFIRDHKIKSEGEEQLSFFKAKEASAGEQLEAKELQERIQKAIDHLPEKCRIIFMLSRFEELSYKEIAERLDISTKTVENQISKALRLLRQILGPYI